MTNGEFLTMIIGYLSDEFGTVWSSDINIISRVVFNLCDKHGITNQEIARWINEKNGTNIKSSLIEEFALFTTLNGAVPTDMDAKIYPEKLRLLQGGMLGKDTKKVKNKNVQGLKLL